MSNVDLNLIPVDETQLVIGAGEETQLVLGAGDDAQLVVNAGDETQLVLSAGDNTQIVLSSVPVISNNGLMLVDGTNSDLALGNAGIPSLKFNGDANTGIFSPGADQVSISTGGTERLRVDGAGQIEAVSLGSAAAPTFSFTGDPNTGIFSPGADQLAISTAGTGRLFIDASGNVTARASDDSTGISLNPIGGLETWRSDGVPFIDFKSSSAEDFDCRIQQDTNGLRFLTGGNGASFERLRITSAGNVGIGTSSPGENLSIGGGANLYATLTSTNGIKTAIAAADANGFGWAGTTTNHAFALFSNNAERLRITSAGLVGIGTSSPGTLLDTRGFASYRGNAYAIASFCGNNTLAPLNIVQSTNGTAPGISAGQNSSGAFQPLVLLTSEVVRQTISTVGTTTLNCNSATSPLQVQINSSEVARIDSSGRLGIGTTSPAVPLDVVGQIRSVDGTVDTRLQPLSGSNAAIAGTWSNHAYVLYTNNTERLRITSAGNVGIGTTSPAYALDVQVGDARFKRSASDDAAIYFGSTTNNYIFGSNTGNLFVFATNGTERARIDSSGRLLVGTSSSISEQFSGQARIQTAGTGYYGLSSFQYSNDVFESVASLCKSRGATVGTHAVVQANDSLASLRLQGSDGTGFLTAASITAQVDGTAVTNAGSFVVGRRYKILTVGDTNFTAIGASANTVGVIFAATGVGAGTGTATSEPYANSMPGRLVFSTTADGAASPTERMRITSAGRVGIGTVSPGLQLDVSGSGGQAIRAITTDTSGVNVGRLIAEFTGGGGGVQSSVDLRAGNGYSYLVNTTNTPLLFGTNSVERARLDAAGGFRVKGAGTAGSTDAFFINGSAPASSFVLDSAGRVGIGTTSPGGRLQINIQDGFLFDVGAGAYTYMRFGSQTTAEGVAELAFDRGAGAVALKTGSTGSTLNTRLLIDAAGATIINNQSGTERARIDSSGNLLVGTSVSQGTGGSFQVGGSSAGGAAPTVGINAFGFDGRLRLSRATNGSPITIVASGDRIGRIAFDGYDGATYREAATVAAEVDGTPGSGDMPGRIVLATTADGAPGPTERMRIDSAGRVGIGTTGPTEALQVANGNILIGTGGSSAGYRALYFGATSASGRFAYIEKNNDSPFDFNIVAQTSLTPASAINFKTTPTSTAATIDSSGRLLVGTSASTNFIGTAQPAFLQLKEDANNFALGLQRASNDSAPPNIAFRKTRATTDGGVTVVADGDTLGQIRFIGTDGTGAIQAATIRVDVDGTPGTNDMPGRVVLATTADGATTPTERFRITNDGVIAHDQPAPAAVNATATLTIANLKTGIITSTSAAATDMTLPTGTDTQAGFSGTYDNFTFEWSVINTGPSLVRVLAGTAHTIVGSGSVATGTSGRFASRRTAANTFVTYRLT